MKRRTMLRTLFTAALVCSTIAFAADPAPPPIKANPKSKIYHKATCQHYKSKGATKTFKTEAEAKKAGYKACKQCAKPKVDTPPAKEK